MFWRKERRLNKAYKLVYKDLCEKHRHVMAAANGTLHRDDIQPQMYEIREMILYIVEKGKEDKSEK